MKRFALSLFFCIPVILLLFACPASSHKTVDAVVPTEEYLNLSDSAKYVGMNTCRQCHQGIYETFIKTGMGRSIHLATKEKSAADFSQPAIYDPIADFHYRPFWENDSMYIREFRLLERDTVYQRTEQVNFIIGSGQHTNSHLTMKNGYIHQMPATFYTQKQKWDLPPGFDEGHNTRFSRKIGLECMSCHNSLPDFVIGSENKYRHVPLGIGCERCHGPGSIHVEQRQTMTAVDTSRYIDYSIVNPGKLSADRQFDICQRCHLQGNTVLKEGRSFYDFKPGMKLSDVMTVFLPKYTNSGEEFIMASHADRLKMSPCFIQSQKNAPKDPLRPARGGMTCVTCHNPHLSVKETNPNSFNDACIKCHADLAADDALLRARHPSEKKKNLGDCVSCHMPVSGPIDIPHVSVHDHYIHKPLTAEKKNAIKKFIGLYAINEASPEPIVRAQAFLNQFEKFEQAAFLLDSARIILAGIKETDQKFHAEVQLYFASQDMSGLIRLVEKKGNKNCMSMLNRQSYDNRDAWTAYRIAESFLSAGNASEGLDFITRATELAPFNPEFRSKKAALLASNNKLAEAEKEFLFLLSEHPDFVPVYSNLGYIRLVQGNQAEALRLYKKGLSLDPDNEALLLNLAGYYIYMKNTVAAREILLKMLKKDPQHKKAKSILQQLAV